MKIKKFKSKQILKLHLLKSRVYEQIVKKKNSTSLTDMDLLQTITNFKKALQVIFQYHNSNKFVLFIGVPKKLEFRINRLTKHVAVSNIFNLQGIISNYSKNFSKRDTLKNKSKTNLLRSLQPKLSKKPDLIVLFSHEKKANIIIESSFAKIPLIIFNNETNIKESRNTFYTVSGNENNLMSDSNKNLFSMGLNFLFKTRKKRRNITKSRQNPFFENSKLRSVRKRFV